MNIDPEKDMDFDELRKRRDQRLRAERGWLGFARFRLWRWQYRRAIAIRWAYQRAAGWGVERLQGTCGHDLNQIIRICDPVEGESAAVFASLCGFCGYLDIADDDHEGADPLADTPTDT